MDAPQVMPEDLFARMMEGAIKASMNAEAATKAILDQATGSDGKATVIHLPGQAPVFVNAPNNRQLLIHLASMMAFVLQTTRIMAVALNDLDSRFRLADALEAKQSKVVREDHAAS